MMKQAKTNTPDEPHEPTAVLDGQTGTGAIAIFYGAAHYPFELARQRELVEDYADTTGLNLVTEFHDRQQRQHGLSMLLDACQRGGVDYVITAGWPTPNLTTTEADAVLEQPNGKSTTTHIPVPVPAHRGAAISTEAGLMQTVLQPYPMPCSTSRRISLGVNSGFSTE